MIRLSKRLCFVIFLIAIGILSGSSVFADSSPTLKTRIKTLTVYPEMALVKQEVLADLKIGENVISVVGLTPDLMDNSLQVSVNDPKIKLLDVKVYESHLQAFNQAEVKKLKDKIESIEKELFFKKAEKDAIKQFNSVITKTLPQPKDQQANIPFINSYFEVMENALKKVGKNLTELDLEISRLEKEKENLEKELTNYGQKKESIKIAEITLYSKEVVKNVPIDLSFLLKSAGWKPYYSFRIDSQSGKYSIDWSAMIWQKSGIDWKDAEIRISTQKPASFRDIPEAKPWYIDISKGIFVYPMIEKSSRAKSLDQFLPEEEQLQDVKVEEEVASVSFILPRKISIPSDGKPHMVVVDTAEKNTTMKYTVLPRVSLYAYLTADIENPFNYPILAGESKVYLDGKFVGDLSIKKNLYPGEKKLIPFGIDESIKVDRKLVKKFTEYQGAFNKEISINYEYLTEITNGKSIPIEIDLRDNIPVSKNEKIKIDIKEPKEIDKIGQDGSFILKIYLNAKESYKLKTAFKVTYPVDLQVKGLE